MARKTRNTENPEQEEVDVVPAEHAGGEVSGSAVEEEGREEVVVSEDERLAEALINFGYNEVYADAQKRVSKLTKQERAMLLDRVSKPPE